MHTMFESRPRNVHHSMAQHVSRCLLLSAVKPINGRCFCFFFPSPVPPFFFIFGNPVTLCHLSCFNLDGLGHLHSNRLIQRLPSTCASDHRFMWRGLIMQESLRFSSQSFMAIAVIAAHQQYLQHRTSRNCTRLYSRPPPVLIPSQDQHACAANHRHPGRLLVEGSGVAAPLGAAPSRLQ